MFCTSTSSINVENINNVLRVSICLTFGVWGLLVPFRQRLLHVFEKLISPPTLETLGACGDQGPGAPLGGDSGGTMFDRMISASSAQES
jgi:hypothetical protein